ncbi:hypothetical protein ACE38U_12270 [Cedecea sp. S5-13]|uniref:hypothetical protein n=1 Tax=Cedecea selenatireducens TaxID=3144416 RepID=UPI0035CD02BB
MKIKSKSKKLRDDFQLSHVAWFFVGILATVAFQWIVYKDPKQVTAPGISTLVAMSAFMLALWSAFKVNKWLNNKVNESGFKQTEKILESISKIHTSSRIILENCKTLSSTDIIDALANQSEGIKNNSTRVLSDIRENIVKQTKTCEETNLQLQVFIYELPMWNITLKNKAIENNIINITSATKIFTDKCNEIEEQVNKKNIHYVLTISNEITNEFHPILFEHLKPVLLKNYHEIFTPVTSPSKKAD